jgi:ankyrin repeat protein
MLFSTPPKAAQQTLSVSSSTPEHPSNRKHLPFSEVTLLNSILRKQLLASSYWRHPASARLLLLHGANVEVLGTDGFTTASYLFGPSRPRTPQTEFIEILACNSLSHFNAQGKIGWTVLHRAAVWGTAADVQALISVKASTQTRTLRLAWTPVFCAVCYGNMDTLRELWKYDNDPHQRDFRGWNLLHVAAGYGNFAAVPFLIERGVDLHALSDATARFVPPLLRGKCVAPGDIARGFGQEAYGK